MTNIPLCDPHYNSSDSAQVTIASFREGVWMLCFFLNDSVASPPNRWTFHNSISHSKRTHILWHKLETSSTRVPPLFLSLQVMVNPRVSFFFFLATQFLLPTVGSIRKYRDSAPSKTTQMYPWNKHAHSVQRRNLILFAESVLHGEQAIVMNSFNTQ